MESPPPFLYREEAEAWRAIVQQALDVLADLAEAVPEEHKDRKRCALAAVGLNLILDRITVPVSGD